LVAGILKMSPLQFYAANILSALAWAPAHVFPGVLLAMAIRLGGASAGQLTFMIVAGLMVASAACGLRSRLRFQLHRKIAIHASSSHLENVGS
jgi:membrane protein DedA with SNARE-associated domain